MREEQPVERVDEGVSDEKLTWEKPALKVFSIDDTAAGTASDGDGLQGASVT